jgi:NAD+ diphosphatase
MNPVTAKSFTRLVNGLQESGKVLSVVESCCGGLINSSIMAVPGSSAVYYGGSIAYNTKKAKKLLLDDEVLHNELIQPMERLEGESEADAYIRSKLRWTEKASIAFCEKLGVDYAIAEGGASGPTFRPKGLTKGFAVLAIAGKTEHGKVELLGQSVIHSTHANRKKNMNLFAKAAADLALEAIGIEGKEEIDGNNITLPQGTLAVGQLDRAAQLRTNSEALKELEERSDAKYVVLRNASECLFTDSQHLGLLTKESIPQESEKSFLGLEANGTPIFQIDVDDGFEVPDGVTFANTRAFAPLLPPLEYELVLYSTALAQWKSTHRHCSVCGAPTVLAQGGSCLKCSSCKAMSWPRQDPSIIVLVTNRDGDKALLARSPRHPKKVHTCLAGFVEAGETLEMAVCREVFKETGVNIDRESVTYLASQPWPFPRSFMLAFRAEADDSQIVNIDENELVSAHWFTRSQVELACTVPGAVMKEEVAIEALEKNPSLELLIPPAGVVARTLIDNWLGDA